MELREAEGEAVVRVLVENHRRFLSFLERRVGSHAVAEELLQAAYVRTLEKGHELREGESAVAWFYRLLRNALVDHYRKQASEGRAMEREAREATEQGDDPELKATVCACMGELLPTLKPEYAELLQRVDLEERAVPEVAAEVGITPNNAGVRLHRARQALKKQLERSCGTCATHGCLDCSCQGHREPSV
ncbi:RNA polymerase sigma factor [Hyalangium rubrum]|uniref:Sigma-70 family RNA polymerase sigma factor n=1 Tax=Hyalangium rubrum TaxID=3103134 RepID=A0ABU5H2X2_9BACT|nr:sigma-70 family RNA polymerase sigma factor [Hyalangium sp. s54d21]MDY7227127.1 sigma-70 family RNA polymerase sigma factor [Hyalangium sp. s54d21]